MKLLFVILDGLGDRPCGALKGRTPLEAASTPNLDFFARKGKCGLMYPIAKSIAPESDAAISAILSYDPLKHYCGRGPLEAYGLGIRIKEGQLALRCNFATLEKGTLTSRRAGRTLTTKEGNELAEHLNKHLKFDDPKVSFRFEHSTEHRAVLIIKASKKLSRNISNTDPGYKVEEKFGVAERKVEPTVYMCLPLDKSEASVYSAELVNEFIEKSYALLRNHGINKTREKKGLDPANVILTRDAGNFLPKFKTLKQKYELNFASIVGMPLEIGLTKLAGMEVLSFKYPELKRRDVRAHLFDELATEIKYSKIYLNKYWNTFDAFYIHFKETDIPGHDGLPKEKRKMIEMIDKEFFSWIREQKLDALICVTADHCTPCETKAHSADPVPLLIYSPSLKPDKVKRFGESECKEGSLGMVKGINLLAMLRKIGGLK